jgi:uncharacterized protein (TIGR02265 family)
MFAHTVEALLRHALPQPLPERYLERARRVGVDLELLQPAYPIRTWIALLALTREELLPDLTEEDAYRELGRLVVRGHVRTPLGRAMAGTARLMGPARVLTSLTWVLRSASNFMRASLTRLGPRNFVATLNAHVPVSTYNQGVLLEVLAQTGAEGAVVDAGTWTADGLRLEVRWETP